jgi:predicted ATPase/class 3 adenylate cyclase
MAIVGKDTGLEKAKYFSFAPGWLRRLASNGSKGVAEGVALPHASAVLVADIAGFTPLADSLAGMGAAGAEQLSVYLSDYLGKLLEFVDMHGGEVFKFAGDALIAQWEIKNGDVSSAVQSAAACALAIQNSLHLYRTEGGKTTLALRVAVMNWDTSVLLLKSGGHAYSAVLDMDFGEVAAALKCAQPGEVILSPAAWSSILARAQATPVKQGFWRLVQVDRPPSPKQQDSGLSFSKTRTHRSSQIVDLFDAFVPEPARDPLSAGHGDWLCELRQVTVIFSRLSGLELPTSQIGVSLQSLLSKLEPIIRRCGGYIREFGVDDKGLVLVGVFGLPTQGPERAAERATRAGLEIHAAVMETGCSVAIGVASGACFCGVVGSDLLREYVVIGDAMNVAARLMDAAFNGIVGAEVICDASTQNAMSPRFEWEPLPSLVVKGKPEPLQIARPVKESKDSVEANSTLVGRKAECEIVRQLITSCINGKRSGLLILQGEPGIGKTRVVAAISQQAMDAGVRLLSGAGDAVEVATPYFVWRKVFMTLLGRTPKEVLQSLGPTHDQRAPLLDAVLAIGLLDTSETLMLAGSQRANATRDLLVQILSEMTETEPTIIVLEDGHWFDSSSWGLLLDVARRLPDLLLVVSTRPLDEQDYAQFTELKALPDSQTISLSPLTNEESIALVCNRLGVSTLPNALQKVICAQAQGLPLYAEELTRSLLDTGFIKVVEGYCLLDETNATATTGLPATLQGVICSRLDRLSAREALAMKVCSVLGTSFDVGMLREVYPVAEDRVHLPAILDKLDRSGFLSRKTDKCTTSYEFSHILLRQVAYDKMLFSQRVHLHRSVAEWLRARFGEEKPELLATLAHHWQQAGLIKNAVSCLEKCALRTFSLGLGKSAVDYGLQAARLLDVHLPTDAAQIEPLLGSELVRIDQILAGRQPMTLLDLQPMENDRAEQVISLLRRIMPFAHQSLQSQLFALMALRCMTLTLLYGNGERAPVVYAMYSIVLKALTGKTVESCRFAEMAMHLDSRQGELFLPEVSFIYTWFNSHWQNPLKLGMKMSARAAEVGLASGDELYGCFNLAAHVVYLAAAGTPLAEVMRVSQEHHERIGNRVFNASFHCLHELQMAKALAGLTIATTSLTDSEHHEELELKRICDTDNYNQIGYYHIGRLKLFYWFGQYVEALQAAEHAKGVLSAFAGQVGEVEFASFYALALAAYSRECKVDEIHSLQQKAQDLLRQLERWSVLNEDTFCHKVLLLQAELLNDHRLYESAATSAAAAGYTQFAALAHELHARALRISDQPEWCMAIEKSIAKYCSWGAAAKVKQLEAWISVGQERSTIAPH